MVCFFPRRRREVSGRYTIGNQMYFYKEYLAQKEKSLMINKYWRLLGAIDRVFSSTFFRQCRQVNCRNSELDENFG